MTHGDLAALSATEIVALVKARQISPVEVVEASLDRIEHYNPTLNAVVTLNEQAMEDAGALESSIRSASGSSALCGVPVGIKDLTPVAGLRTTYGSPIFSDHIPTEDAMVVQRLRSEGAIIVGKTNTPEFGAGASTFNEVFGRTRNPWNPERTSGGSTGGGASALASGMIAMAEGSDLGGSLRIPASFCGLVGLRPSPGLVPTHPTEWLWDELSVSGPMARTAEDVALALQVMAGSDPRSPRSQSIQGRDFSRGIRDLQTDGLRLGYCPDVAGLGIDPGIAEVCRSAALGLKTGGADVEPIEVDLSDARKAFLHLRGVWMVTHMRDLMDRIEELGDNVRGNVEAGLRVTSEQIAWAHGVRQNYPESIAGRPMKTYVDWFAPTFTLSLTGLPIASVPCGLDDEGLPVGLQIVGPPAGEEKVLGLCARIQEMYPIGYPDLGALDRFTVAATD
jgi:amidase